MRKTLGVFAAILLASQAASAANIFVRSARGSGETEQLSQLTEDVKSSISDHGDNTLVDSESQADFVLQPRWDQRNGQSVVRIEKYQDGTLISSTQQPMQSLDSNRRQIASLTETAVEANRDVAESDLYSSGSSSRGMASEEPSSSSSRSSSGTTASTEPIITRAPASAEATGESRGSMGRSSSLFGGPGYFSAGVGPSFAVGLNSDNVMYNFNVAYNIDFTPEVTGKAFGDFNIGSGNDTSRFINVGGGVNWYPHGIQMVQAGRTYLTGDLGYGTTRRNETDNTRDNLAIGAGAGFQFMAANVGLDVSLHYTLLTAQINENNPQILGARVAVNF